MTVLYPVSVFGDEGSFEWTVSSQTIIAGSTGSDLPLWLHANRYGTVDYDGAQASLILSGEASVDLGNGWQTSAVLALQGQASEYSTGRIVEGYGRLNWMPLELTAGRFQHTVGTPDPLLSTGSMAISANALPIPRVRLAIPEYWSLPRTQGWLQVKAGLAHGWVTDDRHVDGALLHEKFLFGRVYSPSGFHAHAGLIHEALWAGDSPNGQSVGVSWDNFRRVFLIKDGGDDATTSDQIYKFGNHLGTWDFGLGYDGERWSLQAYYQHFGEDASGTKDFENEFDGLWGLEWRRIEEAPLSAVVYEFVYTRDQSGPYTSPSQDRDSYYSHGYYLTGWTFDNAVVGNALFGFDGRDEERRIDDNRFVAHHLAVMGTVLPGLSYRTAVTHKKSYPAYAPVSLVEDGESLRTTSLLIEATYAAPRLEQWEFQLALGADIAWDSRNDSLGALAAISFRY